MSETTKIESGSTRTENMMKISEIQEFFRGCNVFLTGGTGFLGKLMLEKLLRSCRDIKKVYLLVREKKGLSTQKRLEELFESNIFSVVKETDPKCFDKVVIIEGDCMLPNLGLSEANQQRIVNDVTCIFHFAATVRFDEKIRTAAYINVRATRDLLVLSRNMKKLKSFVYVSTAYSFCPQQEIKEMFYEPVISGDNLLRLVEDVSEDILERITPKLLGKWPNTYSFSKSIAEQVIQEYGTGLPIAILRPSIVISTAKEPLAGWIDNVYGPVGTSVGIGVGLIRVVPCDGRKVVDVVPADYVINCAMAVSWEIGTKKEDTKVQNDLSKGCSTYNESDIEIYNYISSSQNRITFDEFMTCGLRHGLQNPTKLAIWYPNLLYTSSDVLYKILSFLLHILPAYIVDFVLYCIGKKPMLIKGYKKIHKFMNTLSYFSTREWNFCNKNTLTLWKKLSEEDKHLFGFDIETINWDSYLSTYIKGGRMYLLKDPLDTVPQAKKKQLVLKVVHYVIVLVFILIALKMIALFYNVMF